MPLEAGLIRFVRGLLAGAVATRSSASFVQSDGRRAAAKVVGRLISIGAIAGNSVECRSNTETASWLRRAMLGVDEHAAQHRMSVRTNSGTELNLAESPLTRLAATGAAGEPAFLQQHHLEAGERVRRLCERAHLQPRLTMAYSASRTAGRQQQTAVDISDLAADARRTLADLHKVLPRDCAGVVLDVCGLLKGLQEVERDRGWPRRSAKLVLRIGLDQLAQHYGLGPFAIGRANHKPRKWMDEGARPERFE